MADYKEQLIKKVSESLVEVLSKEQIEKVSEELIRSLKEYDVTKSETQIVPYSGENEAILKRFCACLMVEGKSEKTIAQYRRTAVKLFKTAQRNYTEMGVYDIRMFLALEKQRGISNRTLENQRANLSSFFQWMTKEEIIQKNPCMNITPIKYADKVRTPFSTLEIAALKEACTKSKDRAIVELLLSSGLRVSEMTNIKLCDLDFNTLSIHVTKGKGNKERTVYMSELARKYLIKYIESRNVQGEYLFYNLKKNPLNAGGVRYILNELAKKAHVTNVHPHRFRRTLASDLAKRGMSIQDIKKILGHSDINTTMEYVYTSDEQAHASYLRFSA